MAGVFQPPPTWALPVVVDEHSGKSVFNPIWLRWFIDLSANLGTGGAGSGTISGVTAGGGLSGGGTTGIVTVGLAPVGTAGTYTKITFNTTGQETSGTAAELASADYANQGTIHTLLHGNAAGNPAWSAVDLATDVSGNLPPANLNSGTGASSSTFWRGDGTWSVPSGAGNVVGPASATSGDVVLFDGITGKLIKDGGVLGSAAFTASGSYDAAGAASTVQGNLNTHTSATGTAVHGLGSASTHATTDFQPSGTYVTSVGVTAPVATTGGTAPTISMAAATGSVDGYLTHTDWTTFNGKQPAGSYLSTVTADSPLAGSGTSGSHLSIPAATSSISGYLSSTDWSTFNGKQPAGSYLTANQTITLGGVLSGSGATSITASFASTPWTGNGANGTASGLYGAPNISVTITSGTSYRAGSSSTLCNYQVVAGGKAVGPLATVDLASIVMSVNYASVIVDINIAGIMSNGANFYAKASRYVYNSGGSSIALTTLGVDSLFGCTVTLTWTATNTFKVTVTSTVAIYTGSGAFSIAVSGGGQDSGNIGTITSVTLL